MFEGFKTKRQKNTPLFSRAALTNQKHCGKFVSQLTNISFTQSNANENLR
jgi:hypothetical protein